jgi:hypothetical protein
MILFVLKGAENLSEHGLKKEKNITFFFLKQYFIHIQSE